jgi:hypothetical protein
MSVPDKGGKKAKGAGPAEGSPPEPVVLRFRSVSGDGRVAAAERLLLARPPPPPARLGTPWFGHALYRPGESASITVAAEGVQKGSVHLVIEKEAGGAWSTAAELDAPIDAGQAWASWKVPPEEQFAPVQYRVRAVADFGEATSDPCTVQRPDKGELTDPQFSHAHPSRGSHFDHGDEAVMKVTAKGLDGRKVAFVVEQEDKGKWDAFATVEAIVAGGVATAKVVVKHSVLMGGAPTQAELQKAGPMKLRFHAELA